MAFQLDHLHTLVALVEEGTFEAAAQRLRVTASAVSQRVKAMEQAAGQVLIQRVNPVIPTAAGDIVLRHARQVQLLEGDVATELGAGLQPGGRTSLPLAVNADCLGTWFLDALAAVPADSGAVFDIYREDQEHTTSLLRSGTVMAAVTSTAEAVQGCSSVLLGSMRYRAVASPRFVDTWLGGGWVDLHRQAAGDVPGPYTWWSWRGQAFDTDTGWRIDYQVGTGALAQRVTGVSVDRAAAYDQRWSDHAAVVADYDV